MSWYILAVLQTTALGHGGSTSANWIALGEFRGEKACVHAAQQLSNAQASSRSDRLPQKFVCLPKDLS